MQVPGQLQSCLASVKYCRWPSSTLHNAFIGDSYFTSGEGVVKCFELYVPSLKIFELSLKENLRVADACMYTVALGVFSTVKLIAKHRASLQPALRELPANTCVH